MNTEHVARELVETARDLTARGDNINLQHDILRQVYRSLDSLMTDLTGNPGNAGIQKKVKRFSLMLEKSAQEIAKLSGSW